MNKQVKKTVSLRIYFGREVLLKADAKTPANENQKLTLDYNDTEWEKHLSNLKKMGICKVEVIQYYEDEKEMATPEELTKVIERLLSAEEVTLTPEQEEIKKLKEQNEALHSTNKKMEDRLSALEKGGKDKVLTPDQIALKDAQAKYKEKFKKDVPPAFKNKIEWINEQLNKQ